MKEVLADRLDSLERPAVDEGRSRLETTLRRIDAETVACEPTSLQTRRAMEGMPSGIGATVFQDRLEQLRCRSRHRGATGPMIEE